MDKEKDQCGCPGAALSRRALLKTAVGLGMTLPLMDTAFAAPEPKNAAPKAGDRLVYAVGDRKGEVIKIADLKVGDVQTLAFPMETESKTVRDGNRLNQVIIMRLDPAELTEETRASAAEGVVVYSSICTHQGCDVSQWKTDTKTLLCVCHGSEYDPKDRAKVTFGPAPRRLAMLPVKAEDGVLVATGGFAGKPGPRDL